MGAFGDIPPGTVSIPPGDLTTAAIEAINLILSQLGISPLDALLSLLSGRPKNLDTQNVIDAYNRSAYWPLHALAANLAMALRNGAPISDSRPQIQAEFGTWKQGTVKSIQGFAGVQQGPNGPGYWTLAALINQSWAASGGDVNSVLKYVKAIDALTQVLSQIPQPTKPSPPPPLPPPETPPPPGPLPPPPTNDPRDDDELSLWARRLMAALELIIAGLPTSTGTPTECCDRVVTSIGVIATSLTAVAAAIASVKVDITVPPAPGVDLTPLIKVLGDIDLALRQTLTASGVDLAPVVDRLNAVAQAIGELQTCVCEWVKRDIADRDATDAMAKAAIQYWASLGLGDSQVTQIVLA